MRSIRRFAVHACLVACGLSVAPGPGAQAATLTIEESPGGRIVKVDGQLFAEYLTKSGAKPIVWPIIGPSGVAMTRSFPMERVKGEFDHPHQRSLWFTHGNVNGIDFWSEGSSRGKTEHREFKKSEIAADGSAVIETVNDWVDRDGKKHLEDVRRLTFRAGDNWRSIDFDITLRAPADAPVTFGDTKEGTMGIRVPTVMTVDRKQGGKIVNSRGQADAAAWGMPAEWVDYHGTVDGHAVGVAVLNHPTSFRFPTHWHVRTYGLFAANPFGLHDFPGGESADGSHTLQPGEEISLRYRFLFHEGDEKQGGVQAAYDAYAREPR